MCFRMPTQSGKGTKSFTIFDGDLPDKFQVLCGCGDFAMR